MCGLGQDSPCGSQLYGRTSRRSDAKMATWGSQASTISLSLNQGDRSWKTIAYPLPRSRRADPRGTRASSCEATSSTKPRLVDQDQAANAAPQSRSGAVQPSDRQASCGCDVVAVRVDDIAPSGYALDRAPVRQKKTGRPVRFELTDQTRQAIDEYLRRTGLKPGELLFPGRRDALRGMTTRQYTRLVRERVANIGLDPGRFGTTRYVARRQC
jgi:hypothetical protein